MGTNTPYNQLREIELPKDFAARCAVRLETAQKRAHRMYAIRYGVYAVASITACVVSAVSVSSALSQSGAYEFLALVFRDTAAFWYSKEIVLSIAESLPILGVASLIGTLFFSGVSVMRFFRSKPVSVLYV